MNPHVSIRDVTVDQWVLPESLRFASDAGMTGDASFTLKVPAVQVTTFEALLGEPDEDLVGADVAIDDPEGSRQFGGSIDEFKLSRMGLTDGYSLEVVVVSNWRKLERRRIPPCVYKNMTAGDIIRDLIGVKVQGEGIGIGTGSSTAVIMDGATITKVVYDWTLLSEALLELAEISGYIVYLDPFSELYFVPRETNAAPFTLTNADVLNRDFERTFRRSDVRTRQFIRVNFSAFSPSAEVFSGDGATQTFTLERLVNRVESIVIGTDLRASVAGTFTGVPSAGDTQTINGVVYTWRVTIDNTLPRELQIGASASACASVLHHAVNDTGTGKGTTYSAPTTKHPNCTTTSPSGGTLTALFTISGTVGNGITVAESCSNFTWAATSMSGGADGEDVPESQEFGVEDVDTDKAWYFAPGETTINQRSTDPPVATGKYIEITYRALGTDVMFVQDDAAVAERAAAEGTSGLYENMIEDTQNVDAIQAYDKAKAVLDAFKAVPDILSVPTRRTGLQPGMLLPVQLTKPRIINADYFVDSIEGAFRPSADADYDHFSYVVSLINSSRVGTWRRVWDKLAKDLSGGGGGGIASAFGAVGIKAPGAQRIELEREVPSGTLNGSNQSFTLRFEPSPRWAIWVFLNGIAQNPYNDSVMAADFVLSGNTITYTIAPKATDKHFVYYLRGVTGRSARRFSGADYINWGNTSDFKLTGDMSFGAWIKLPPNANGTVVSRGYGGTAQAENDSYKLGVAGTTGAWNLNYSHDYGAGPFESHEFTCAIPNNTWKYVGFTRDATAKTIKLWVGDAEALTLIETWTYTNNTDGGTDANCKLMIGTYANYAGGVSWSAPFVGTIQEHYVWGEKRTQAEHLLAAQGLPPAGSLLLACFMGQTPEIDVSGDSHTSTITGTELVEGH